MVLIENGDDPFTFDLKSGYRQADIVEVHHIAWEHLCSWATLWSVYTLLPVTRLMRPLVCYWREPGLTGVVYTDGCRAR